MGLVVRFGRGSLKKFIQNANERSRRKGTIGSFRSWCNSQKLTSADGKVTLSCINKGLKSKKVLIRKRANYARNIGGYKNSKFGKKKRLPSVSATKYPVGTIKTGLDKKKWIVKLTSKGVKRWVHLLKKRKGNSFKFGKPVYSGNQHEFINTLLERERLKNENKEALIKQIEKEIKVAEKIIEKYPENDTLKRRALRLLSDVKRKLVTALTVENLKTFIRTITEIVIVFSMMLGAFAGMSDKYHALRRSSKTFVGLLYPIEYLLNKIRSSKVDPPNGFRFNTPDGPVFIDPEIVFGRNGLPSRQGF